MSRIQASFKYDLIVGLFLVFLLFQPLSGFAQAPCDPNLRSQPGDPLGYRFRKDRSRCEGRYIQEVAGTILITASLTEAIEDFDPKSGKDLVITWQAPQKQPVHLRAQGVLDRLFYRMDADIQPDKSSFQWPIGILAALINRRQDIGILGWMSYSWSGGTARQVYLPLRIHQQGQMPQAQTYQVVLWPEQELTEVFISLAPMKSDGSIGPFLPNQESRPLNYGFYPAGQKIEFDLPAPATPGIYYLEIGATLESGRPITIENWFYHAG